MRLRITTAPPLEPLKSLIAVPRILLDDNDATIHQLKQHFCDILSCLTTCRPDNISISVEGFDVPEFNPLSVLHDGDLLLLVYFDDPTTSYSHEPRVKLHAHIKAGMKRKREDRERTVLFVVVFRTEGGCRRPFPWAYI